MNEEDSALIFVEKYRPKTIDECIIPDDLKEEFNALLKTRNLPNLILKGTAGVGKTTVARAMCEQLECDYITVNGSKELNMDMIRVQLTNFVTTVSLNGRRKVILVDEADGMPAKAQGALKSFIEEHSKNCGWIFTCNHENKIIDPIKSRCATIGFTLKGDDRPKMAAKFMGRVKDILANENITYDTKVVAQVVMNNFPDFRKTLNMLQLFGAKGHIDEGILAKQVDVDIKSLISALKEKNFKQVRQWCENNADSDMPVIFQKLYDNLLEIVNEVPQVILIISDYQYKEYFVANKTINLVACLVEIMASVSFK